MAKSKIKSMWQGFLDSLDAVLDILFYETVNRRRLRERVAKIRSLTPEQALAQDRLRIEEDLNRVIRRELRRKG